MQVLSAGDHKFLLLELDPELVASIAKQAGFEYRIDDTDRALYIDLAAAGRQAPLLLFDAADPGNLGWFRAASFMSTESRDRYCKRPSRWRTKSTVRATRCGIPSGCKSPRNCRLRFVFRAGSR